jgi:hypothetical protein
MASSHRTQIRPVGSEMLLLMPSSRHGVGVFTTKPIAADVSIRLFRIDDWKYVVDPRGEELKLCRRYGVCDCGGFHRPRYWERMSIGWYLNHSAAPNIRIVGPRGKSLRAIGAGVELTIDYDRL